MNSMCHFMENIFIGTKYIQNVVENLEEAFQTKTKRGVGVSLAGASFSQDCIFKYFFGNKDVQNSIHLYA